MDAPLKEKIASRESWGTVAQRYVMEWMMVWEDVTVGFTVAGIIAAFVPKSFFQWLFIGGDNPNFFELLAQALVGPVAAFFTFIGSMGTSRLRPFSTATVSPSRGLWPSSFRISW